MTRLLWTIGISTVNFVALFFLIHALHRMFFSGPGDFGGVAPILAAVVGIAPIVKGARALSEKIEHYGWPSLRSSVGIILLLNITAGIFIIGLWRLGFPLLSDYHFNSGKRLYEQGEQGKAIKRLKRSIYLNPGNSQALLGLASIHEETGDDKQATIYYRLATRNESTSYAAFNNLSLLHLKKKEYDDAIELLLRAQRHLHAIQGDNDNLIKKRGIVAKNLAWAYWEAKEKGPASEAILEAVSEFRLVDAVDDYPEVYCLQALLLPEVNTNDFVRFCEAGMVMQGQDSLKIRLLREAQNHNGR